MGELAGGKLGPEGEFHVELTEAKNLKLSAGYLGKDMGGGAYIEVHPRVFLDKLKAAIPGQVDDFVIEQLERAFGL